MCIVFSIQLPSLLFAQASDPTLAKDANSLSGKVTDSAGNPLIAASVYIPDLKAGTQTDKNGAYIFRNLASGRHLIEVSFVGYATLTEYADISGDVVKDFVLSPSILENNEVVVTGVTSATQIKRSPVPVMVVKREDLLKGVAVNLIDGLAKQPGISQISTGPAISKPVIRGLGYNRVVVVNDGVRQEGQQWGDEHDSGQSVSYENGDLISLRGNLFNCIGNLFFCQRIE